MRRCLASLDMTINGGGHSPPPTPPEKNFCRFGGNSGDPSLRSGRHFVSVRKGDFCPFRLNRRSLATLEMTRLGGIMRVFLVYFGLKFGLLLLKIWDSYIIIKIYKLR